MEIRLKLALPATLKCLTLMDLHWRSQWHTIVKLNWTAALARQVVLGKPLFQFTPKKRFDVTSEIKLINRLRQLFTFRN